MPDVTETLGADPSIAVAAAHSAAVAADAAGLASATADDTLDGLLRDLDARALGADASASAAARTVVDNIRAQLAVLASTRESIKVDAVQEAVRLNLLTEAEAAKYTSPAAEKEQPLAAGVAAAAAVGEGAKASTLNFVSADPLEGSAALSAAVAQAGSAPATEEARDTIPISEGHAAKTAGPRSLADLKSTLEAARAQGAGASKSA